MDLSSISISISYSIERFQHQTCSFASTENLHSTKVKEMASETICHEISHQWFGDTVTETWWDDLFLSEGFATLFETVSQKMALPEQVDYLEGKFLVNTMQAALTADTNITYSHPLYDIDDITYKKGGSILRMIETVLGKSVFQSALQSYIRTYQFSSADHEMLFEKFTEVLLRQLTL
uniref:Peptidase_M1 domain-containing protein n=1 Tax=Ascaris lumbricoides TaxID=6252 RepID=A0A0M3HFZ8_ASCLU